MTTCSHGHRAVTYDEHYGDYPCPVCEAQGEVGSVKRENNNLEDRSEGLEQEVAQLEKTLNMVKEVMHRLHL
jgi:hypothetical protein